MMSSAVTHVGRLPRNTVKLIQLIAYSVGWIGDAASREESDSLLDGIRVRKRIANHAMQFARRMYHCATLPGPPAPEKPARLEMRVALRL